MNIPATPMDISPAWLTEVLRAGGADVPAVTAIAATDIGEGTGIFGDIAKLTLTYDAADDRSTGPASVVAKLPCTEPANLEVALALGIYEREVRFFDEIAPTTSLRVPQLHYGALDGDGRFVLIMEDMSVAYDVGDQVVGITPPQAEAVIDMLAPFHVRWWESPELAELDWVPYPNAPQYVAAVPQIYRAGLPVLEAEWTDRLPAAGIELARRLEPAFEALIERTATGPTTFIHTDTRLDNFFFAKDGSGEVAIIDFQLALRGRGVADVAYLVGTSMNTGDARECWEGLLGRWHAAIVDAGLEYSWDDCLAHYREATLYYLSGAMSLVGSFDTGNERGEAMAEAYVTRIVNHCLDIGADVPYH